MIGIRSRLQAFWRTEEGTQTVESSLVAPAVLMFSVVLVALGFLFFRQALLYADARLAAERISGAWDASAIHPVTGAFSPYQRDGLYWRLFNNGDAAFGWGAEGAASPGSGDSLSRRKLERQQLWFPLESSGLAAYHNGLFSRKAEVRLDSSLSMPDAFSSLPGSKLLTMTASAPVTDPAETIRHADLLRSYIPLIMGYVSRGKAGQILDKFRGSPAPAVYAEEAQARRQLQQTVKGKERTLTLTDGDQQRTRLVDAIDRESIGHQALLGAQSLSKEIRQQIEKDKRLVETGQLQGVVWHFYRNAKTGKMGPSKSLLRELEKAGIGVVLHE
ncbi:TadE/TadG family type IV pilus assembly protein [Paenibacillus thermoaerophilus]|uniref:TadE/TadG family type IV pilus assembly protein n=1 Tax=Paenibacillus thermoaerophilus TaxID=1215385 RepID=A0ABW2V844_9BACL|nr:hypothetical protein [Paenibacillus thermoaerophilus]TMV17148.1 hypothetical protein FE781_08205 [Paenibacillus thermoaerophilus]